MSRLAVIAQAVVGALNRAPQPFAEAFTAVRSYRPHFDLEDIILFTNFCNKIFSFFAGGTTGNINGKRRCTNK